MSKASEHSTLSEQYPLNPCLTKYEWTAPTVRILGILAFLSEMFLSVKIRQVLPSLTEVSASSLISSILSLSEEEVSNVQSNSLVFFKRSRYKFNQMHIQNV